MSIRTIYTGVIQIFDSKWGLWPVNVATEKVRQKCSRVILWVPWISGLNDSASRSIVVEVLYWKANGVLPHGWDERSREHEPLCKVCWRVISGRVTILYQRSPGRFGTYLYFCILGIQRVWMFPRRALGGATAITGVPKSTGTGSVSLIGEIGAHVIPHGAAGQGCKHATLAGSPCRESHFGGYPLGGKQCLLRATAWHKNSHLPLWWLVDLLVSNCTFHVPPWRPTEQVSLCVCFRCKTSLISRQYFTITTTCDPIE